jgi:ABC-type polysaccharide/polyol phosphate export permease
MCIIFDKPKMIVKEKIPNFELLFTMIKTDFKLRYYGSVLGFFWSLLKPLLMFLVLYTVFTVFIRWNVPNFQLYLLLGIIIWNFFSEATVNGINSLQNKSAILKKVYFPRIFVVISSTATSFLVFLLNLSVFFVFYLFSGLGFSFEMIIFPFYVVLIYFFALGLSLILSIVQVYFKDMIQIWEVALSAGFYLSPIIYPLALVPREYWKFLFINPITGIVQYSRILLIDHNFPSFYGSLYLLFFIFCVLIFGFFVFKKYSKHIIEKL